MEVTSKGPCGYDLKARIAGCCDGGDELAQSCSCGVFAARGSDHSYISDESACEGVVESAAAVARLTKAAETSLAVVVAVMVYCNWIEVVMLVAALLL